MRISDWSSDVCSSDLKQRLEEYGRVDLLELDGAGLQVLQQPVLFGGRKLREGAAAELPVDMPADRGARDAVELRRGQRQLVPLLGRALLPRSLPVHPPPGAVRYAKRRGGQERYRQVN